MSNNTYLSYLLNKYSSSNIRLNDERLSGLKKSLKSWGGWKINYIELTGSNCKQTSIKNETDCDLLLSFKDMPVEELPGLYNSLSRHLNNTGFKNEFKRVGIKINTNGLSIDLIPGIKQNGTLNYHKLYHNEFGVSRKTNLSLHVNHVLESKRQNEIKLLKIWRNSHKLYFPSLLIEVIVIRQLKDKQQVQLVDNLKSILNYLAKDFVHDSIIDPANSNSHLSSQLSAEQKILIQEKAVKSLAEETIDKAIW